MRILVTCFDPFGCDTINASQEAVMALPDTIGGAEIVKAVMPVVFGKSIDSLRKAIDEHRPDAVVCVGQASGRCAITPERVAINLMDARIADNSGQQPIDQPIAPDGPAAYFSMLPVKAMVAAMQEAGIPASVSNTAGTYVCNQLMYGLMHLIATEHPAMRGGFIHVPLTSAQAATKKNVASMALSDIVRGLETAIGLIAKNTQAQKAEEISVADKLKL